MASTSPHDELLDMVEYSTSVDEALTAGMTPVYQTIAGKWHTDPSCHHLHRGGLSFLRVYPLERLVKDGGAYSQSCTYCAADILTLEEVIREHEPELLVDGHRLTTLDEWEAEA